jgi:hypothetical protein
MRKITVGEKEGKFFLVGEDGYSTTRKIWASRAEAQKAALREQKLTDEGKPSRMAWEY